MREGAGMGGSSVQRDDDNRSVTLTAYRHGFQGDPSLYTISPQVTAWNLAG